MAQRKIWITSDSHFNHSSMIKNQWRPFKTVKQMNETIINNWNRKVNPDDIVFHLGDVVMNQKSQFDTDILPRLNGEIIFVRGNHDRPSQSHITKLYLNFKGKKLQLLHDPNKATIDDSDIIIHGHIHVSGKHKFIPQNDIPYYNTNVEQHKYAPKLLNEIIGEVYNPGLQGTETFIKA